MLRGTQLALTRHGYAITTLGHLRLCSLRPHVHLRDVNDHYTAPNDPYKPQWPETLANRYLDSYTRLLIKLRMSPP